MRFLFLFLLSFTMLLRADVHEGDYFITGGTVETPDVVTGDVYALGSNVHITGRVDGDVIATGGTIMIDGIVQGSARLVGGEVILNGKIVENFSVMGGKLLMNPGAVINGNGVFTGGDLILGGTINGKATINSSTAMINGTIGKNVDARAGELRLGPNCDIRGNLEYKSSSEVHIDPGAKIAGQMIYHQTKQVLGGKWKERVIYGSKFLAIVMNFWFSFVFGVLYIKLFPGGFRNSVNILRTNPWKAFWVGILAILLLPIICLLLLVSVLGFPLGLALLAFSLITFYTAKVIPIVWISSKVLPKLGTYWGLLLGLIVFFFFLEIPVVGVLLSALFILLGLGAGIL
jgi:cytoskeletal protein CcmA (bactofilin family)